MTHFEIGIVLGLLVGSFFTGTIVYDLFPETETKFVDRPVPCASPHYATFPITLNVNEVDIKPSGIYVHAYGSVFIYPQTTVEQWFRIKNSSLSSLPPISNLVVSTQFRQYELTGGICDKFIQNQTIFDDGFLNNNATGYTISAVSSGSFP
jgi:hypothetical protein